MDFEAIIEEQFSNVEQWRIVAFGISCAQRVKPIIVEFSSKETKNLFEEHIDILWKMVNGENVDISKLMSELESRPEYHEDDSLTPSYYAMRALAMLYYSIYCAMGNSPIESVINISNSMLNLCADIDSFALDFSEQSMESLENLEVAFQNDILTIVKSEERCVIYQVIQEKSRNFNELLNKLIPFIRKGHGWS